RRPPLRLVAQARLGAAPRGPGRRLRADRARPHENADLGGCRDRCGFARRRRAARRVQRPGFRGIPQSTARLMRIAMGRRLLHLSLCHRGVVAAALAGVVLAAATPGWSQSVTPAPPSAKAEAGPKWSELSPAQRTALTPLEREWSTVDADRKQKWIQIAGRMPSMPPAERERVQARMTEWARMSPQQRGQARLAFEQAKQVSPKDRQ